MASEERRLLSAKRICAGRMLRREEFPEELFSDAPWSMLMLAYLARGEGRALAPADLYDATAVSHPVGGRWAAFLEQQGLLTLGDHVSLTTRAIDRLDRYLDRVVDLASGQTEV